MNITYLLAVVCVGVAFLPQPIPSAVLILAGVACIGGQLLCKKPFIAAKVISDEE